MDIIRAMQMEKFKRVFRIASLQSLVVAVLLLSSRLILPLSWLTLPATWPGVFILGMDETQERYGYWGELVLLWLCSLPCVAFYAWLLDRRWQQRKVSTTP
jgi:hypothetical protein